MIYRDERGEVQGVWNRAVEWTAKRNVCVFADGGLAEVESWLDATPRKWAYGHSETNDATQFWDLQAGYAGTRKLAKEGWQEGVDAIQTGLQAYIPAAGREAGWGYGHSGSSVNIGRFLRGAPKAMRSRRKREFGTAPVLHLVVNLVASCAVGASQMANYGAAIAGLIDRLEASGRRLHVDVVMVTKVGGDARLSVGWNVRRANQYVAMNAIAFSIAHPAAFRRLGFAMMERTAREFQTPAYGNSADVMLCDAPEANERSLLVDGVNHEPKRCNTPQDALRLAIEQINKAAVIAGHASLDEPLVDEREMLAA